MKECMAPGGGTFSNDTVPGIFGAAPLAGVLGADVCPSIDVSPRRTSESVSVRRCKFSQSVLGRSGPHSYTCVLAK